MAVFLFPSLRIDWLARDLQAPGRGWMVTAYAPAPAQTHDARRQQPLGQADEPGRFERQWRDLVGHRFPSFGGTAYP